MKKNEKRGSRGHPVPHSMSDEVHRSLHSRPGRGVVKRAYVGAPPEMGAPLFMGSQSGFGLVQVLLGIGVLSAVGAGAYSIYQGASVSDSVRQEQDNIAKIAENAQRIYGTTGSYVGINIEKAIAGKIAPDGMVRGEGLSSRWGRPVIVEAAAIEGVVNTGVKLIYRDVPVQVCSKLVHATAASAWDVEVGGQSVFEKGVSGEVRRGVVDRLELVKHCASGVSRDVSFVFNDGASGLSGQVMAPVSLPAPSTSGPGSPGYAGDSSADTHVGQSIFNGGQGQVLQNPGLGGLPTSPVASPAYVAPSNESSQPVSFDPYSAPGRCIIPAVSQRLCKDAGDVKCDDGSAGVEDRTEGREFACPSGQVWIKAGTIGRQSRQIRRYMYEKAACPDPYGKMVWQSTGSGTPWLSVTEWDPDQSPYCAPACIAPAPVVEERPGNPQYRNPPCPHGQMGDIVHVSQSTRTRTISYSCPNLTGNYTTTIGHWTVDKSNDDWKPVTHTCAPACVTPPDQEQTMAGVPESRTTACPSGQSGSIIESRNTAQSRTITYECPSGVSNTYKTITPAWSVPAPVGAWTEVSNTCEPIPPPLCVAPAPVLYTRDAPEQVTRTLACPSGFLGAVVQASPAQQTGGTTYSCPQVRGPYVSSESWSVPVSTEMWATVSYGCVADPSANPVTPPAPSAPPASFGWERVSMVYGPGMGCHLYGDLNQALHLSQQPGSGLVAHRNRAGDPVDFTINESELPCNESSAGQSVTVLGSCGGWQSGLEGSSGWQCRPSYGYVAHSWVEVSRVVTPELFTLYSSPSVPSWVFAPVAPGTRCLAAEKGKSLSISYGASTSTLNVLRRVDALVTCQPGAPWWDDPNNRNGWD